MSIIHLLWRSVTSSIKTGSGLRLMTNPFLTSTMLDNFLPETSYFWARLLNGWWCCNLRFLDEMVLFQLSFRSRLGMETAKPLSPLITGHWGFEGSGSPFQLEPLGQIWLVFHSPAS